MILTIMLYCFLSNYTEQQFVNGTLELNNIQQVDKDINSCHPADTLLYKSQELSKNVLMWVPSSVQELTLDLFPPGFKGHALL